MAKISTYHNDSASKVTPDTPKLALFVDVTERMFMGEDSQELFEKFFTEDFWWSDPESHIISPQTGGKLYGAAAVDYRSRYYRFDGHSFKNIGTDTLWSVETEDTLFRKSTWWASDPVGEYTGFEEGERKDEKVTMVLMDIIKFRDGKIASVETMCDMLGYHYDMAGGDLRAAAQAFINAEDWWMAQKKCVAEGRPTIDDPGKPFCD